MLKSLAFIAQDIVYGPAVMVLALVLVLLELAVLVLAVRRRKRGPKPLSFKLHAIVGAAIAALPLLVGMSVHAARATMLAALGDSDPTNKAMALSRGITGQINGI